MKYRIREQNELKPSGVEWLGDIPKDWQVSRISSLFTPRSEKVSDKDFEALSVTKHGIVKQLESVAKTDNGDNRKKVLKNDFVINSRADRKGSCGVSSFDGSVSLISHVLTPNKNIFPSFANYLFRNHYFSEEFYRWGTGIVADLWSTNIERMKKISIPFLNFVEQQKIAHFLDEKSKIFDDAISKKEQLITKLELAKQALISEVVTGKLKVVESNSKLQTIKREPSELKPSGVAWLGDIPQKWQVKKLKYLTIFNNEKSNELDFKIALENIESKTMKYIETKENVFNDVGIIFKSGDILFGKLRPYLAKVYVPNKNGICVGDFFVLSVLQKIAFNFYIKYLMVSDVFIDIVNSSAYGTKMPRASWDFVGNLKLPFPNLTEQQQISKYLDEKLVHFDNTIEKTKQSITKLKQAKEALISQAVTGKIEVIDEESKANEYFQRRVLAAYFIDKSQNDISFGRVKLQKMLYMAEAINNLDFKSDYHRHAMGPHDSIMLHSIESQLKKAKWFEARKIKNGDFEKVEYRALENHAEYLKYLDGRYWKQENIEYIFNLMKGMLTLQAEIVATVYMAYIDLSKQNRVSQENLLDEILNHWHDNKKKIPKETWLKAIEWMCEKQLIKV